MLKPLTLTPLPDIPLIRHGDNLADIILNSLQKSTLDLLDGDILVITQKIISKVEGRMIDLSTINPGKRAMELAREADKDPRVVELILRESSEVLRVRPGVIIVAHRLGFVCANAGVDRSNVSPTDIDPQKTADQVLLLPADPDKSAEQLRSKVMKKTGCNIAVMIIDSHGRAWRLGTVGVCIGISGLPATIDERGWKDLFGYTLQVTVVGVADELAAAASLIMGQAGEGTPVVHVRGFPYPLRSSSTKELIRPKEQDLFR